MKNNKKNILIMIGAILFQTICYNIGKLFALKNPYLIETSIDKALPFLSFFIIFYALWYIMLIIVPCILLKQDKEKFYQYNLCVIINALLSLIVFIAFPTSVPRYNITTNSIFDSIVKLIYALDTPTTCLPSIHASSCFIMIYFLLKNKRISKNIRIIVIINAILIILSTLFVKQHAIYDIVASLVISTITFFVAKFSVKKAKNVLHLT